MFFSRGKITKFRKKNKIFESYLRILKELMRGLNQIEENPKNPFIDRRRLGYFLVILSCHIFENW